MKGGKAQEIDDISLTIFVSKSKITTSTVTEKIATSEDGIVFVIFGKKWIIAIVKAISQSIINKGEPDRSSIFHKEFSTWKCSICARKITIAKPFTNQSITGCGTNLINFQILKNQASIWKIQAKTTAASRYSKDCSEFQVSVISGAITTAIAQVAQEIIPALHQKTDVISQIIAAA